MGLAALDTNVLVRLVVPDQPELHRRARELLASPGARFLVCDHAFVELVFVLERHYRLGRGEIADVVAALVALENVECRAATLAEAAAFWEAHPKLSFEDCLMAEQARAHGAVPLWSFDRKLANQHPAVQEVPLFA